MNIQGSEFPEDLYYDPDHYWLRKEADGTVTMGMNDFAQKLAGEIVFVQLPKEGKAVKKGKKLAKVESGKWLGKIMGPLDGAIKEVNLDLENQPTLINQDCYGKGWMYRITPDDPAQLEDLIHGAAIEQWAKDEAAKHQS